MNIVARFPGYLYATTVSDLECIEHEVLHDSLDLRGISIDHERFRAPGDQE